MNTDFFLYLDADEGESLNQVWTGSSQFYSFLPSFQGSYFCSQTCFKGSWDLHKALHKLAKSTNPQQNSKPGKGFNPWPGYMFTGRLRPAEQSAKRAVPDHIKRPDYADHPEGFPLSEQKLRGNTYVRQLDDQEIEGEKKEKRRMIRLKKLFLCVIVFQTCVSRAALAVRSSMRPQRPSRSA